MFWVENFVKINKQVAEEVGGDGGSLLETWE